MTPPSPYRLTLLVCLTEILGLAGFATFPALLPIFRAEWGLSNTQAGWISAGYYAGYMASVPLLTGITDRIDARRILAVGILLAAASAAGYALVADGFASAFTLRILAGIALAGIYMPGLKIVGDYTEGLLQSRFVSFYTASFSIGASLSYLLAGEIQSVLDWRWAFWISAFVTGSGLLFVLFFVPPARVAAKGEAKGLWKGFAAVFRTRRALGYILGYAAHMWELFALRSWIVAFLVFCQGTQAGAPVRWSATQIAFAVNLIGLPASIIGNELARRFGRRKIIIVIMLSSVVLGIRLGFSSGMPYGIVALISILYGVTVVGDSASLTAGAVGAAPEGYRGATLAVHSTLGFAAAFMAPLAVGMILDAFDGGRSAWALGFICMAAGGLAGPIFITRFK